MRPVRLPVDRMVTYARDHRGKTVGAELLVLCFAVGAAVIALWCHVRWPRLTPRSNRRLLIHVVAAFGVLQLVTAAPYGVIGTPRLVAVMLVVALVVGALTYAFLAALWVVQALANALRGMT